MKTIDAALVTVCPCDGEYLVSYRGNHLACFAAEPTAAQIASAIEFADARARFTAIRNVSRF